MSDPEDEWVYGYLLSYGPFLKVIEPIQLRNKIVERLSMTIKGYNEDEMSSDVHAPEKYGIYQAVGDTVGPGAIVETNAVFRRLGD